MYRSFFGLFRGISAIFAVAHYGRVYGTVGAITKLIVLGCLTAPALAQESPFSTLRGTVVDARTGSPLPRVLVAIEGGPLVETGPDGTFVLAAVPSGQVRLYVSAVGYGLVQRSVQLAAGATLDLRIPLSEGAATYTENVTVTADRARISD